MLLCPFPALRTPFPTLVIPFPKISFKNKGTANNRRILPSRLSLTCFPKIPFTNEEATGSIYREVIVAINEAATDVINVGRTLPFRFFILC